MHPILFNIGPFALYTYGAFLALAFLAAIYLGMRETERVGLKSDLAADLFIVILIAAIIGARIFHVLFYSFQETLEHPAQLLKLRQGGLVYYGGFIFAVGAGIIYCKLKKAPLAVMSDVAAPCIALGQAIGRIGCFMSGCCFGKVTTMPWAVTFPNLKDPRHPTQLYESFATFIIFLLLMWFRKRKTRNGQVALFYALLYAPTRFAIEFFRDDNPHVLLGMTISQVISVFVVIAAVIGAIVFWRRLPESQPAEAAVKSAEIEHH